MEADGTGEWWVKHAWILGGEIDLTLKTDFVLDWTCEEDVSAFDNLTRSCPSISE
jgi:hypothetical protein